MKTRIKKCWIDALPKYKQGFGQLRDGDLFCILGVLCDLHRKQHNRRWRSGTYLGCSIVLPHDVVVWAGLESPLPRAKGQSLVNLNDGMLVHGVRKHSFREIAEIIKRDL